MLNDIIDIASWPTKDIEAWVNDNKPIGLGGMGFADACIELGYVYGDDDSLHFAQELMDVMYNAAEDESYALGQERGIPKACENLPVPKRNVTLLSIAPTGTISIIAGCSSSIEPIFSFITIRQDNTGSYIMVQPKFREYLRLDDKDLVYPSGTDRTLLDEMALSILNDANKLNGGIFVTAADLHYQNHIDIQAAFQKRVDSGVSKTINMPENCTIDQVSAAYMYAYLNDCKGITIYRDGSKFFQILSNAKATKKVSEAKLNITETNNDVDVDTDEDKDILNARRFRVKYLGHVCYVLVGQYDDGRPRELFIFSDKEDDTIATMDALARLISIALRSGVTVERVVRQLRKVRNNHISSLPAILARVLTNYITANKTEDGELECPNCKSHNVELVGGCPTCHDCGYSKCG